MKKEYRYEIREIDAWTEPGPDDAGAAWTWNQSYLIGELQTAAENLPRAIAHFLKKRGIVFFPQRIRYCYDGSIYEIQDRKTGEPYIAAIPLDY